MESLFFGSKHSLRLQNRTRAVGKIICTEAHFVTLKLQETALFSELSVDILSERNPQLTLNNSVTEFRSEVDELFSEYFGSEEWTSIKRYLSVPPKWTCIRISSSYLSPHETVEMLRCELNGEEYKITPHSQLEDCVRLEFIERDPKQKDTKLRSPPQSRVIVDSQCGEAVLRGADVFAPGIKGSSAILEQIVSVHIDLDDEVKYGDKDVKPNRRFLFIGIGELQQNRKQIFQQGRQGLAVKMTERSTGNSPCLNQVMEGIIYLQNLPSCLAGRVLDAQPHDLVLDMCASPGGKTSHIQSMMQDQGLLVACDRTVLKCVPVQQTCWSFASRRGKSLAQFASFLKICKLDSSRACARLEEAQHDYSKSDFRTRQSVLEDYFNHQESVPEGEQGAGIFTLQPSSLPLGCFDRVLLDGPCSALGLRPKFSHLRMKVKTLRDMAGMQRKMIENAFRLVKVGGFIVYSTCTFNPEENEHVVAHMLSEFAGRVMLVETLPRIGRSGMTGVLSEADAACVQRFDPSDMSVDSIGFFVAKFQRIS